jgi:hypothetical protein
MGRPHALERGDNVASDRLETRSARRYEGTASEGSGLRRRCSMLDGPYGKSSEVRID